MARRKTECYPFWNLDDIRKMTECFDEKKQYHWRLAFMLSLLMGRRIGDTISLKWYDLFTKTGKKRKYLEIEEQKTEKVSYVLIPDLAWKEIKLYIKRKNIDPSKDNYEGNVFPGTVSEGKKDRRDDAYRKAFLANAEECQVEYRVNTHSTRKSFGYYGVKLHPYDPANVDILQKFFNHATRAQTLDYIGLSQEKQDKYSSDWSNVLSDVIDGKEIAIENTPVVTLKSNDLRDIIVAALKSEESLESLNKILGMIEDKQVI